MNRTSLLIAAALVPTATAFAQLHVGDIIVSNTDSQLWPGIINPGTGLPLPGKRAFGAVLGLDFPNFTSNPGFDTLPGAFSPTSSIGFNIRKALHKWDHIDFHIIPPEHMQISYGPLGPVSTPDTDVLTPGLTIAVGPNGQWHRHLSYLLTDPASDGIYLLELELFSTDPSIQTSRPFWMVFNQNDAADFQPALDWVQHHDVCVPDFNGDGQVNVQDFLAFLSAYAAADPLTDITQDAQVNVQDFLAFLALYAAGCN
jgi:hypothetical protein